MPALTWTFVLLPISPLLNILRIDICNSKGWTALATWPVSFSIHNQQREKKKSLSSWQAETAIIKNTQNKQSSLFPAIQSLKILFTEVLESMWLTNSWLGIRHNSQKEWQMLSLWDQLNFQNNLPSHRIQACVGPAAVFEGWTLSWDFSQG